MWPSFERGRVRGMTRRTVSTYFLKKLFAASREARFLVAASSSLAISVFSRVMRSAQFLDRQQ